MYVFREDKNGNLAMAEPCSFCYSIIKDYGIKRVVYTINEKPGYKIEKL